MSDILQALKSEVSRLSRKEINKQLDPVRRVNAVQRGLIAELRRQVIALQKDVAALKKSVSDPVSSPGLPPPSSTRAARKDAREGFWITGKGIRSLRKRLGIKQPELARLAGVSTWTVVNWERNDGKIALRQKATEARLQEVRTMGKRAAAERLSSRTA